MTYRMWRLSEAGPGNLGLACTDDGLLFGRTPLIERRNGRFAVRERYEIERLLQHGHRYIGEADRLMPGLAVVARALNADDPCLARIAAVQLKLPDLPNEAARAAMEAEDSLIKYARDEGDSTDWIRRCIRAPERRPIPAGSHRLTVGMIRRACTLPKISSIRAAPTLRQRPIASE